MAVTAMKAKNTVESLRDIVQDLVVPELKALKVEMSSVHSDVTSLRNEMNTSFDAVRTEMRLCDEKQTERSNHLAKDIQQLSDRVSKDIQQLSEKFDRAMDIRERLASVEARLPR
jgi:uncharacterized protein (DUF3084 family)